MSIPEGDASTIKFGTGLDVTDEGASTIRVDAIAALIADITLDAEGIFDVDAIPDDYSDLLGVLSIRGVSGATPVTFAAITFNHDPDHPDPDPDPDTNYYYREPYIPATPPDPSDYLWPQTPNSNIEIPVGGATAFDQFSTYTFLIPYYSSTDRKKHIHLQGVVHSTDELGTPIFFYYQLGGLWDDSPAIDRLTIAGQDFAAGSQLRLYGRT